MYEYSVFFVVIHNKMSDYCFCCDYIGYDVHFIDVGTF